MDDIMPIRFTNSGKWSDKWFRNLSPYSKTLYWYLWDVCDIAGFWEIDLDHAAYHTKIPEDEIEGAFKGLARGFVRVDGHIWIRRFLYHQRNLPLNTENNAHIGILRKIDERKSLFPDVLSLIEQQGASKGLNSSTSISKSKSKGNSNSKGKGDKKFIKPSPIEVHDYAKEIGFNLDGNAFVDFYAAKGWKVGKNGMKDWKAAVRTWKSRHAADNPPEKKRSDTCHNTDCDNKWSGTFENRQYCTPCLKQLRGY
jgi:hypothetical protein